MTDLDAAIRQALLASLPVEAGCGDHVTALLNAFVPVVRQLVDEAQPQWQPMESAPKGGGAELTTDPAWVEPPRILSTGPAGLQIIYWDWYYADGGNGFQSGQTAWVGHEDVLHEAEAPTRWMPLPAPPQEQP
jgi:hypothetical protein